MKLRQILRYIGVSEANMEEGSFRCDANISLRPVGANGAGAEGRSEEHEQLPRRLPRPQFEVERQREVLDAGRTPVQETRGWVEDRGGTVSQRTKEYAHDYRYFPEPDLPPLTLRARVRREHPRATPGAAGREEQRFIASTGSATYEAHLLTETRARADYFEACLSPAGRGRRESLRQRAKAVSNWMLGDFARLLNQAGIDVDRGEG